MSPAAGAIHAASPVTAEDGASTLAPILTASGEDGPRAGLAVRIRY